MHQSALCPVPKKPFPISKMKQEGQARNSKSSRLNPPPIRVSAKKVIVSPSSKRKSTAQTVDLAPVSISKETRAKPDHMITSKRTPKVLTATEPAAEDHGIFSVLQQRMERLDYRDMVLHDRIRKLEELVSFAITRLFDDWKIDDLPIPYQELPYCVQLVLKDKFIVEGSAPMKAKLDLVKGQKPGKSSPLKVPKKRT